jgi:uncharacterized protein (TIGR02302 family)
LPERPFTKPLARALIEQRKLLIEDPRYSDQVLKALMALTTAPEGFIDDTRVYLPLRATVHRLGGRKITREVLDETIDQLWHTALRIEDGDLSEAEKNLRDIQDRLAKALEDGASDEEIRKLMQELRQAFQEYAQEMQKQNGDQQQQQQSGDNKDQQQLSAEDLDRMMREMEQMAENGLRDQAKDMLAQMRDLMERLQQGQQNAEQQRQNKEMAEQLKKLGEAVGEQQSIMDDTFEESKQQQQGQGGQQMRQSQPGQKGKPGQGMQADRSGQSGQGDDQGDMGLRERGTDEGQGQARGQQTREQLAQRQAQLREKIDQMRRDMQQKGLGEDEKLGAASEAMDKAEDALREGDLDEASEQQSQALQEMREGAEQMAQQMQQNGNQQAGENGDNSRDPMGRPQRSQGPDQGRSVKVPDQIDIQRAREVLEELRKRAGDAQRPQLELDYIDRLLRWY